MGGLTGSAKGSASSSSSSCSTTSKHRCMACDSFGGAFLDLPPLRLFGPLGPIPGPPLPSVPEDVGSDSAEARSPLPTSLWRSSELKPCLASIGCCCWCCRLSWLEGFLLNWAAEKCCMGWLAEGPSHAKASKLSSYPEHQSINPSTNPSQRIKRC